MKTSGAILFAAIGTVLSAGALAQGKEVLVDGRACFGGTVQSLATATGVSLSTYQLTGPISGGPWDGGSVECLGTAEVLASGPRLIGYCVIVDKDGDKAWGRDTRAPGVDTFEYLGGTGKYAGISGMTKGQERTRNVSARAGTFSGCVRTVGSYRVP